MADTTPRIVHFHQKHHEAIISGEKVTTVRWNESVQVGAATFVFDDHPTAEPVTGTITAVQPARHPHGRTGASAAGDGHAALRPAAP